MGFKSTLITEEIRTKPPKWFVEKWKGQFYFGSNNNEFYRYHKNLFPMSSRHERKFYNGGEEEIFKDLQKVVRDKKISSIVLVLLHECGGITRVKIDKDKIVLSEPNNWKMVEQVEHDYCYGCSDLDSNNKPVI